MENMNLSESGKLPLAVKSLFERYAPRGSWSGVGNHQECYIDFPPEFYRDLGEIHPDLPDDFDDFVSQVLEDYVPRAGWDSETDGELFWKDGAFRGRGWWIANHAEGSPFGQPVAAAATVSVEIPSALVLEGATLHLRLYGDPASAADPWSRVDVRWTHPEMPLPDEALFARWKEDLLALLAKQAADLGRNFSDEQREALEECHLDTFDPPRAGVAAEIPVRPWIGVPLELFGTIVSLVEFEVEIPYEDQ